MSVAINPMIMNHKMTCIAPNHHQFDNQLVSM